MGTQASPENDRTQYNEVSKKLTPKAILGEKLYLGLEIVFHFGLEYHWTLFDQFHDVCTVKTVKFQESERSLRPLEVIFFKLELL